MGCDDDMVKCLVFWANFFLALVGISVISIGIVYKVNLEEFSYAIPVEYQNIVLIPFFTIPLGSVIIAVAVLGCYGCITEKSNFLTIYGVVLLLVFVSQVIIGICSFFQLGDRHTFDKQLSGKLNHVFSNYAIYENKEVVDLIQHRLRCCGINGPVYWNVAPRSCYETDTKNIYKQPCPALVSKYLDHCLKVVGIITLTLSFTEVSRVQRITNITCISTAVPMVMTVISLQISGSIISLAFANYLRNAHRRSLYGKGISVYNLGTGII